MSHYLKSDLQVIYRLVIFCVLVKYISYSSFTLDPWNLGCCWLVGAFVGKPPEVAMIGAWIHVSPAETVRRIVSEPWKRRGIFQWCRDCTEKFQGELCIFFLVKLGWLISLIFQDVGFYFICRVLFPFLAVPFEHLHLIFSWWIG